MPTDSSEKVATSADKKDFFTHRKLNVTFRIINEPSDSKEIGQVLTLTDHAVSAVISNAGKKDGSTAEITIAGMEPKKMARLSMIGSSKISTEMTISGLSNAIVEVTALEAVSSSDKKSKTDQKDIVPVLVFRGFVVEAYQVFEDSPSTHSQSPETHFKVTAQSNADLASRTIKAQGYPVAGQKGSVTVDQILRDICNECGLILRNHGLSVTLSSYYRNGTAIEQINKLVEDFQGVWSRQSLGDHADFLDVWPRKTVPSPIVLPPVERESGLIGYPSYSQSGCTFKTIFRPDISFWVPIEIISGYLPAAWMTNAQGENQAHQKIGTIALNGFWVPHRITHRLSSDIMNGEFLTEVKCVRAVSNQPYDISEK